MLLYVHEFNVFTLCILICVYTYDLNHQREMVQCLHFLAPHYYRVVKSKICFCLSQICSKAVSTSSQLAVHMKTHTEDCSSKFFKCFLCDERFKGPAEVRKHVVVHAVNGKYTCPKVSWQIYCMFCCMPQPVKTGLYCKLVVCQTLELLIPDIC